MISVTNTVHAPKPRSEVEKQGVNSRYLSDMVGLFSGISRKTDQYSRYSSDVVGLFSGMFKTLSKSLAYWHAGF